MAWQPLADRIRWLVEHWPATLTAAAVLLAAGWLRERRRRPGGPPAA